jgi:hypothetical protein
MRTRLFVASIALSLVACGPKNNGTASTNNDQNSSQNAATNSETSTTNGATNGSSNNGGTNGATNGQTSTNGNTGSTNNGTNSNTNNGTMACTDLDPALGPCDPICQTGCDDGDHCVAGGDPLAAMCGPAGAGEQGQACQEDSDCGVGLHCRSVGGGALRCSYYCNPLVADTGCPPNHACNRLVADQRLGACIAIEHLCDAVPTDTCADPEECYDTLNGRRCVQAGDTAEDGSCTRSTDCQVGLRCVEVANMGLVCQPICDPDGGDGQCADGDTCHALQDQQGDPLTWGACY